MGFDFRRQSALVLGHLVVVALFGSVQSASADLNQFTYEGRLFDLAGAPMNDSAINFRFQIVSDDGACVLFEENVTGVDASSSASALQGVFSHVVGSGARSGADPGHPLAQIFSNLTSIGGVSCSYSPLANASRRLRVFVDPEQDGTFDQLSPDYTLTGAPIAATLEGRSASDFLQVGGAATQSNILTLVGGGDVGALHHHDSRYVQIGSAANQNLGSGNLTTTGTIGVGTASPAAPLHVVSTSSSGRIRLEGSATTGGSIELASGGALRTVIKSEGGSANFTVEVGGTTALHIDAARNAFFTGMAVTGGPIRPGLAQITGAPLTSLGFSSVLPLESALVSSLSTCGAPCSGGIWYNAETGGVQLFDSTRGLRRLAVVGGAAPANGEVLKWNSASSQWEPGAGAAGINQLNGESAPVQSLSVLTNQPGPEPSWSSSAGVHTLRFPSAAMGGVNSGLLSNADFQSFNNRVMRSGDSGLGTMNFTTGANLQLNGSGKVLLNNGIEQVRIEAGSIQLDAPGTILRMDSFGLSSEGVTIARGANSSVQAQQLMSQWLTLRSPTAPNCSAYGDEGKVWTTFSGNLMVCAPRAEFVAMPPEPLELISLDREVRPEHTPYIDYIDPGNVSIRGVGGQLRVRFPNGQLGVNPAPVSLAAQDANCFATPGWCYIALEPGSGNSARIYTTDNYVVAMDIRRGLDPMRVYVGAIWKFSFGSYRDLRLEPAEVPSGAALTAFAVNAPNEIRVSTPTPMYPGMVKFPDGKVRATVSPANFPVLTGLCNVNTWCYIYARATSASPLIEWLERSDQNPTMYFTPPGQSSVPLGAFWFDGGQYFPANRLADQVQGENLPTLTWAGVGWPLRLRPRLPNAIMKVRFADGSVAVASPLEQNLAIDNCFSAPQWCYVYARRDAVTGELSFEGQSTFSLTDPTRRYIGAAFKYSGSNWRRFTQVGQKFYYGESDLASGWNSLVFLDLPQAAVAVDLEVETRLSTTATCVFAGEVLGANEISPSRSLTIMATKGYTGSTPLFVSRGRGEVIIQPITVGFKQVQINSRPEHTCSGSITADLFIRSYTDGALAN